MGVAEFSLRVLIFFKTVIMTKKLVQNFLLCFASNQSVFAQKHDLKIKKLHETQNSLLYC